MTLVGLVLRERFEALVQKGPGCWPYTGSLDRHGYGRFWIQAHKKHVIAHRIAFALAHGRDPILPVLHDCDNPPCCRPSHLFEGSQADNSADMARKGRGRKRSVTTHCRHGHEYTAENTHYYDNRGYRGCRECSRNAVRRYRVHSHS